MSKINRKTSTLAILGAKWVSLGVMSQKIYQVLVVVILARILTPEDFGLVTVALMTISAVTRIKEMGMTSALIRRNDNIQKAANAFFFINCLLSVLIYGAIFATCPYIAAFFKHDIIALMLKIMGIQLLVEASSIVHSTLAIKALEFKKQTLITLCDSTVNGSVSIVLAVKGLGVWALVYGWLTGAVCASILWWCFSSWRPSLSLNGRVTKDMLIFGGSLFFAATLDRTVDTLNRIFVGRLLGVLSLGFYDLTTRIIYSPFRYIMVTGQRVALPAFCKVQEDYDQIRQWYLKMMGYSCLLMAPITVCFLLLPNHFVPVIYGEKWMPIVPLIRVFAAFSFMMPFLYSWPVYVSTKRADILLKFTALRLIVTVPFLLFAAKISLFAVCLVELISISIFAPVNINIVMRLINISIEQVVSIIRTPLVATVMFSLTLLVFRHMSSFFIDKPNLNSLFFILLPSMASYVLTIYLYNYETFSELKRILAISFREGETSIRDSVPNT